MSQNIVQFEKVSLGYDQKDEIFQNLNFTISAGSFHYLVGASGAGKSSLIKLIYLGYRGYRGAIRVFNQDLINIQNHEIAAYRRRIGVIFQDFYLLDHLTALDNAALPLIIQGKSRAEGRTKAYDLLKWMDLENFQNNFPFQLSGGQKQRLAVARSLINSPSLVIADEPTGNLDDENAVKLLYLFTELKKRGTTVIFATHNRDLIAEFPYPTLYLEKGHLNINYPPHFNQETIHD